MLAWANKPTGRMTFFEALELADREGYRLPTFTELVTKEKTEEEEGSFWSKTRSEVNDKLVKFVNFSNGKQGACLTDEKLRVWLVKTL